jgi:hypothetical protein
MFDHVLLLQRKSEGALDLDKMKMPRQPGAMVPAAAIEIICRVAPSSGVSVECLPLSPWGLFLIV